jgi:hypothetical protein
MPVATRKARSGRKMTAGIANAATTNAPVINFRHATRLSSRPLSNKLDEVLLTGIPAPVALLFESRIIDTTDEQFSAPLRLVEEHWGQGHSVDL